MRFAWVRLCLWAAAISIAAFSTGAVAAEPVKIRIGWVVTPAELQPIMFAKDGIARHLGKSYSLEAIRFQGTPLMISAMASGDLDIAPFAYSVFATAIVNAGMSDLRVIAAEMEDGVPGFYSNEFFVRADSPVQKVADLKGRVVATNAAGSAADMGMRAMLRKGGLDESKDVTVVETALPNMPAMLLDGKVDLAMIIPPFTYDPQLRSKVRLLFTQKDAMGRSAFSIWTARAEFLAKNRAALVDFMEDALRATRWYTDPANHDEVVKIIADYTKQPAARFASWVFTSKDYYRDPNGIPNVQALQSNVDLQHDLGLLKSRLDVSKYVDLGIMNEAAQRLH
ncbi:MAG TPA: ABC transporter substrate-binding protein [Alphaproteobacteria bacterium]|nr:ABC transporter substrate-binding protein [Alphaproteobacteria bacterium]